MFAEAMACEAIVVTSDIAPMNEYVTDGYNGFLLQNPRDPNELANKIKQVCNMHVTRKEKIGKTARRSVQQFSKERVAELELNVYRSLSKDCIL